jgi:hypothetical protein
MELLPSLLYVCNKSIRPVGWWLDVAVSPVLSTHMLHHQFVAGLQLLYCIFGTVCGPCLCMDGLAASLRP